MNEYKEEHNVNHEKQWTEIKGVWFMSVLRWIIFSALVILATFMFLNYFGITSGNGKEKVIYHCPMHPTYISSQPGDCPICGMTLVPVEHVMEEHKMQAEHKPKGEGVVGLVNIQLTPERVQLIGMKTAKAEIKEFSKKINIYGFVEKNERKTVKVHLKFEGWVEKLYASAEGDFVKKGQPLFRIYSQHLYQTEQELLLLMKSAESKAAIPDIQAIIESAKNRLRLLDIPESEIKRLEKTKSTVRELTMVSPITGYIIRKNLFEGAYVMPQNELFEISDLSEIWVMLKLFENDISLVKEGMEVEFVADSLQGKSFKGKIDYIYPQFEEKLRVVKARVIIGNKEYLLKPGMYGNVAIVTDKKELLTVPKSAVIHGGINKYLFISLDRGHFEPRLIETGLYFDDFIEIKKGVAAGDMVVTSSHFLLDSESRLKASLSGYGETGDGSGRHSH